MRRFLRKLRQLLVKTVLLLTAVYAIAMIVIPNTNLSTIIFCAGLATIFVFTFLFFPKRGLSKNRFKDNQGYIVLKGTNEYEHRLIAKKILNRHLLPNEVVHHINGKRSDNRPINLCLMDRHQHEIFHAWLDWKKKKSGRYPSFQEQKRLLSVKHNGILLENRSATKINTYSTPVRRSFVIEKLKISRPERSEDFSRKLYFSEELKKRSSVS